MKVTVLASGSKGNSTLIETLTSKILIDFGLSYKNMINKLNEINICIDAIDAIFITHEHSDHIKGIETLIKKTSINIFLSRGSYEYIVGHKKYGITYEYFNIMNTDESIWIGDTEINAFLVSHDASEPFGYIIKDDYKKMVYVTDTGYISESNEQKIMNADIYIIEANHNVEMLMCTNRPWYLKQRILGDVGHMCNEDALNTLTRVKGENTKFIYLAHISEEANNIDLLNLTVNDVRKKYQYDDHVKFIIANQHCISESVEV
jgi:phosphoribosyl 1,2-cyclic phosphodiesterase